MADFATVTHTATLLLWITIAVCRLCGRVLTGKAEQPYGGGGQAIKENSLHSTAPLHNPGGRSFTTYVARRSWTGATIPPDRPGTGRECSQPGRGTTDGGGVHPPEMPAGGEFRRPTCCDPLVGDLP